MEGPGVPNQNLPYGEGQTVYPGAQPPMQPQYGVPVQQAFEEVGVYKVEAYVMTGYSIVSPDGSWLKNDISMKAHIGPGYPSKPYLQSVLHQMRQDCDAAAEEQIDYLASKIAGVAEEKKMQQ